jgi:putative ABC transport system permease protein
MMLVLSSLVTDVRHAVRMFLRVPAFTLTALLTLTIGLGAASAVFSVIWTVLLQPLPFREPDRLVMIWAKEARSPTPFVAVTPGDFEDIRTARATLDGAEAFIGSVFASALTDREGAERIQAARVSPGLFALLGRDALIGRTYRDDDGERVAVVSEACWRRRFAADPSIVGRAVTLDGAPVTIVGVMPADFAFPYRTVLSPGFNGDARIDVWTPYRADAFGRRFLGADGQPVRTARLLGIVGRVKAGLSIEQVRADLDTLFHRLESENPQSNRGRGVFVTPLATQTVQTMRAPLLLLQAGIMLLLIVACVNLANLLLARGASRQREFAVRAALGAGRARLFRQLLAEHLLLAGVAGALAIPVAFWTLHALIALAPGDIPRLGEARIGWPVVAMIAGLSSGVALAVSLVTATFNTPRADVRSAIGESGRSSTASTASPARRRVRASFVIAEVAVACLLTMGAGLLVRSFVQVMAVDPGFQPEHLITLETSVPAAYDTDAKRIALYQRLFARLDATPGIIAAGGTTRLPLGSDGVPVVVRIEGKEATDGTLPQVQFRRALHDYFRAMGIALLRGRDFSERDTANAPGVVIINDVMARRLWPGEPAVGRRLKIGSNPAAPSVEVVGVIGSVRHVALEEAPEAELYVPYTQGSPSSPFIVIRTAGEPGAMAAAVRQAAREVEPALPVYSLRPMTVVRAESLAARRFLMLLIGTFGTLALLLAAVGIYGALALAVQERTSEVGVRLALGARPAQLFRLIAGEGAKLAAAGLAIGLACSLALAPAMRSLLFGIGATDIPTLAATALVLAALAALATFAPARRAMRVDPVTALRGE